MLQPIYIRCKIESRKETEGQEIIAEIHSVKAKFEILKKLCANLNNEIFKYVADAKGDMGLNIKTNTLQKDRAIRKQIYKKIRNTVYVTIEKTVSWITFNLRETYLHHYAFKDCCLIEI